MRALVQRVREARVEVGGEIVGAIGTGLLVLLGVAVVDNRRDAEWLARKIAELRIFEDEAGKFARSALDLKGGILVVSQFTLYAETRKGRRPSFSQAAAGLQAEDLYEVFCGEMRALGLQVSTGRFGARMQVGLVNDGPVTIWLDSREARPQE